MPKIIITQELGLNKKQIKRLKKLGEVKIYNDLSKSNEEWLERCEEGDIICTGKFGFMDKVYETKNKFFSLPFVNVKWLDREKLKSNNLTISYTPGGNKEAVAEWVIGMMLILMRKLPSYIGIENYSVDEVLEPTTGLAGRKITILGKGNIGQTVGKSCRALKMKVKYFKKGDDLVEVSKNADVIVNCLSTNNETIGLINRNYFNSLKRRPYFITFTDQRVCNDQDLISALDDGILSGAAHDSGSAHIRNVNDPLYKNLLHHPKLLVTPHIAFNSDYANKKVNDIMIDNIDAWIKGQSINLV